MFDLYSVWDKVKSALKISKHPICKHQLVFKRQVWDRIGKGKYKLKNHHTCTVCGDDKLTLPGEK